MKAVVIVLPLQVFCLWYHSFVYAISIVEEFDLACHSSPSLLLKHGHHFGTAVHC